MEVLSWIKTLLTTYGMVNVIIMLIVVVLTNIIKKPIVNKAESFVESAKKLTGIEVDKSVITSNLSFIPIGLAFVLYFLYGLIIVNFKFLDLNWTEILTNAVVYGLLSISIYDIGKNKIKSYVSKKSYNEAKKQMSELEIQENTETDLLTSPEPDEVDSGAILPSSDEIEEQKQEIEEKINSIISEVKND